MSMRPTPESPTPHDPRNEFTLLCERCGYVLEGLDQAGNCPECGTPIAESLPQVARPGTPWQRRPSFAAFLATGRAMLFHPGAAFTRVRIDAKCSGSFERWFNLATAALLAIPAATIYLAWAFFNPVRGRETFLIEAGIAASIVLGGMLTLMLLLTTLTAIERTGIRAYGRVHKRRITSAVARTVCAHACIGWFSGAVLFWTPIVVHIAVGSDTIAALAVPGLFLGLVHFEILVWIGVKRCRYANRERPAQNPAPTP